MEEKKKRIRPTWTQVRKLEAEIAELKESNQKGSKEQSVLKELRDKIKTLQTSNKHMEDELERVRKQADGASKDYNRARREVLFLRSRGFWSRVFNRMDYEE